MAFDRTVKVYNKKMELLATFAPEEEGISEQAAMNLMIAPTIHLESGGIASLSYQMLAESEKFNQIKDPENIYVADGRYYTTLSENSFEYTSEEAVPIVNVVALERQSLLSRQYHQIYDCGIYCYAKARFSRYTTDGAVFTISASDCSNPSKTISSANAWQQVKQWTNLDDAGNRQTYAILTADEYKPTNWESPPSGVFIKSFSVSGSTATMTIESRVKTKVGRVFAYNAGRTYTLDAKPLPTSIEGVKINSTIVSNGTYSTSEKDVSSYSYNSSTGVVTVNYYPVQGEQVNAVTVSYIQSDLGTISSGATCTFAFGAEAVDEHTVVILPKAKTKYLLTIDGVSYQDSQVKDSRGVVMPRGSGGYAMWAVLKNTGWALGTCDVIATGFDASIDYGCFNIESDMKDTLYNIQYIQQLYGGILDWDSEHKILNYRAENYEDYQAYKDSFNEWKGYVFREGKNMTEKPVITVDNKLITRAYILGYGNLNIKAVNGGKSYIDNFSYTSDIYEGYLTQELIYDTNDEGGQRQLLYWGEKELKKQCRPRSSVQLSVTDLRTVPGLEHEQFNINDVVHVYYWDEQEQKNVVEEQRVIMWEYNLFAMWDCTVELGDKTLNKTDLFKLIYNKVQNGPDVDNSGNIPSSSIVIDSSPGGDVNVLQNYIELIARTTTENSDAIAGLILDTSATHAQVDLFAMYQKKTDNLFTQTYSGLTFYADEKSAQALISANQYTNQQIIDSEGRIRTEISKTSADLILYVDREVAVAKLEAEGYWKTLSHDLEEEIEARGEMGVTLTKEISTVDATVTQHWKYLTNGFNVDINASTGFKGVLTKEYATNELFSTYQKTVDNEIQSSEARVKTYADEHIAAIQLEAIANGDSCTLTLTQHGVVINNQYYDKKQITSVEFGFPDSVSTIAFQNAINSLSSSIRGIDSTLSSWTYTYQGKTFFNDEMIATQKVIASSLGAGEVVLLDYSGRSSGTLYIRGASSYDGLAVELNTPACEIKATTGDLFLDSQRGNVQVKSFGGNLELEGADIVITRAGSLRPYYAGNTALGNSQYPFSTAFLQSDVNVSSSKDKKESISYDISPYLDVFDKLKPCSYKLKNGTSGRTHTGMIAQDVERALEECGIDSKDFAGFCKDKNEENDSYDYSLRYGEFISLCIAKIQQQDKEIREIKRLLNA